MPEAFSMTLDEIYDLWGNGVGADSALPVGPNGVMLGVMKTFPERLHKMLQNMDAEGTSHIVSWNQEGLGFAVHDPTEFVSKVMPKYFRQTKFTSFQRQLNLYDFHRRAGGPQSGSLYFHNLFRKDRPHLCKSMIRKRPAGASFPPPLSSKLPRLVSDESIPPPICPSIGALKTFLMRLYDMLQSVEELGCQDVISWQPHGRCFVVHDRHRFAEEVLPR